MWSIAVTIRVILTFGVALMLSRSLLADWPQWRGPNRDGVVHDVTLPREWPKTLKDEWRVTVGEGMSSPVTVGANVYVFTRQKDREVVRCLDVKSGKEIWRSEPYAAPYTPGPGNPGDHKTRSTPTVAGERLFTLGIGGIFSCLETKTGRLIWRKDPKQYPTYGASMSPLVIEDLCIVHLGAQGKGGLTAFDAATGDVKWSHSDVLGPPYSSPIAVDLAGERHVVTMTQGNLMGIAATTGKKLWDVHCPWVGSEKCITPVLYKDLIIFADTLRPLRAIRLEKSDKGITPRDVWKADGHPLHMSTPVVAGDRLLGFSTHKVGHFFCLDASSGKTLWESGGRMGANAAILNAGSVCLLLTDKGRLIVVKPTSESYEPIVEYQVSDNSTWAHPVFLGDRILIKDELTLRSFRIE
jgi:outer membrane protein assembly factor BamB